MTTSTHGLPSPIRVEPSWVKPPWYIYKLMQYLNQLYIPCKPINKVSQLIQFTWRSHRKLPTLLKEDQHKTRPRKDQVQAKTRSGGGADVLQNVDQAQNRLVECRKCLIFFFVECRILGIFVDVDLGPNKFVECRKMIIKTCIMQKL